MDKAYQELLGNKQIGSNNGAAMASLPVTDEKRKDVRLKPVGEIHQAMSLKSEKKSKWKRLSEKYK